VDGSLPRLTMQEFGLFAALFLKLVAIFWLVKDAFLAGVIMLALALVAGRGYVRVQAGE
jgi:hypothetical protein